MSRAPIRPPLPPGPRTWSPLGFARAMGRDLLGWLAQVRDRHGDVALFRAGPIRVALLSHPDLVREVLLTDDPTMGKGLPLRLARELLGEGLLTSEGESHRSQRRATQPAFRPDRLASSCETVVACTLRRTASWRDGAQVDVQDEMLDLAVEIASETLLDRPVAPEEARAIGRAMDDAQALYTPASLAWVRLKTRLPIPSARRFRRGREHLRDFVAEVIRRRREGTPRGADDLVSALLAVHDAAGRTRAESDLRVRDEALTLLLASFETTSRAITWAWMLLARHGEAAAEVHREVDGVLAGRPAAPSDLERLPFTRAVFAEAMRLFPPAFAVPRQTLVERSLGGYRIPAGTILLLCPYLVQRDPRFFPDPERFDPARWAPAQRPGRHPYAYFPFGGGHRRCIGEAVAWAEGTLVLATVSQGWELSLPPGHVVEPELLFHLQVRGGLPMTLRCRRAGHEESP